AHAFARVLGVEDRGAVTALGLVGDDRAARGDSSQLLAARLARRDLLLDVGDLVAQVLEGGLGIRVPAGGIVGLAPRLVRALLRLGERVGRDRLGGRGVRESGRWT